MESSQREVKNVKVPGTMWQRIRAWFFYVWKMYLMVLPIPYIKELMHKVRKVDYDAQPRCTPETVVITGATRGIGHCVLKKLLQMDFNVIIGARKPEMGLKAVEELRKAGVASGTAKCFQLDLTSLNSVRLFATSILDSTDRIDLLINNAGIMTVPYDQTPDGFESQFQVNYLSHFLLTELLLPKIKETAEKRKTRGRIVNTASVASFGSCASNLKDVENPKVYSKYRAYADSKFCQVVYTKHLEVMLKEEGANVSVYSVHPGVVPTDIFKPLGRFGAVFKMIVVLSPGSRKADAAADEVMLAAISPEFETEGGCFIQNSKKKKPLNACENTDVQNSLRDLSLKCVEKTIA